MNLSASTLSRILCEGVIGELVCLPVRDSKGVAIVLKDIRS